jgi:hypothetical protein
LPVKDIPQFRQFPDDLLDEKLQAQQVDFSFLDKHTKASPRDDPLPDSYYLPHHKRAERLEKSIRNSEKNRAQHERDQIARLLDGLEGHDWLKIMGVSGITEGRKREYEPARDYFIRGCRGILDKFKAWREEEKRRKAEKDRLAAEAADAEEEQEDDDGDESDGDPPDYSDVDHAAAQQLHQEAIARSAPHPQSPRKRGGKAPKQVQITEPQKPQKEFKSFFAKPWQRQAALSKRRKSERGILAFGCPIPELHAMEFVLPSEFEEELTSRET